MQHVLEHPSTLTQNEFVRAFRVLWPPTIPLDADTALAPLTDYRAKQIRDRGDIWAWSLAALATESAWGLLHVKRRPPEAQLAAYTHGLLAGAALGDNALRLAGSEQYPGSFDPLGAALKYHHTHPRLGRPPHYNLLHGLSAKLPVERLATVLGGNYHRATQTGMAMVLGSMATEFEPKPRLQPGRQ